MNYSNELFFIFSQFQITPVIKMEEEGVSQSIMELWGGPKWPKKDYLICEEPLITYSLSIYLKNNHKNSNYSILIYLTFLAKLYLRC